MNHFELEKMGEFRAT